ncbi:MAG: hypothetical protein WC454_09230 [Phycisphaerae bacterium]
MRIFSRYCIVVAAVFALGLCCVGCTSTQHARVPDVKMKEGTGNMCKACRGTGSFYCNCTCSGHCSKCGGDDVMPNGTNCAWCTGPCSRCGGDNHPDSCPKCGGDGSIECKACGGDGWVEP